MSQAINANVEKHNLLECVMYVNIRENMRRKLFENCGIAHLDLNLLLEQTKPLRTGEISFYQS